MSKKASLRSALLLPLMAGGIFALVIKYSSEPQVSSAISHSGHHAVLMQAEPPADVSIVFVIESSPNMFPAVGPNYFDLAKEGILDFLTLPGFPNREHYASDKKWEISVIQFTRMDAREYSKGSATNETDVQWFEPVLIEDSVDWDHVVTMVENLRPSSHHTASLLEMGIREATTLLAGTSATQKHIILLTTGEYRLPAPCPPRGVSCPEGQSPCPPELISCDVADGCHVNGFCNRACHARYFAQQARSVHGITLSSVHLGPEWRAWPYAWCPEEQYPYGNNPRNYCACPTRPDRAGFAIELTNPNNNDAQPAPCAAGAQGKTAKIAPFYCWGEECDAESHRPGTPRGIALSIAQWFCEWDAANREVGDTDLVHPLCDNCPLVANPGQRDCDRDGIGDVCRCVYDSTCPAADKDDNQNTTTDSDGDGVFPDFTIDNEGLATRDACLGGDDCLLIGCEKNALGFAPPACDCDCDHDGKSDRCQFAQEKCGVSGTHCRHDDNGDGFPNDCNQSLGDCLMSPSVCSLGANAHVEDFENLVTTVPGPLVPASPNNHRMGWWVSPSNVPNATIVVDSDTTYGKVLSMADVSGSATWSVESPGYATPLGGCCRTVCDHPRHSEWGIFYAEIALKMNNYGTNAPVHEIQMLDQCGDADPESERVHLRFRGGGNISEPGHIDFVRRRGWWEDESTPAAYSMNRGTYPMNQWFTIRIGINNSWAYDNDDETQCAWNGNAPPVSLMCKGCTASLDWTPFTGLTPDELGDLQPSTSRGIRLRFSTTNNGGSSASPLKVGSLRIAKSDRCELAHPNDLREPDERCACGGGPGNNSWHLVDETCGNGVATDPGEECDPPDCAHCDEACHWICGDGIVQGENMGGTEDCDPPGFRPTFDVVNGVWNYATWKWCTPDCKEVTCTELDCCVPGFVRPCCQPGGPDWCCNGCCAGNPPPCGDCTILKCGDGCLHPDEECEWGQPNCSENCELQLPPG